MTKIWIGIFLAFHLIANAQTDPTKYGMVDKDLPLGLKLGEQAPSIEGLDQFGTKFSLKEALKNGPVIITFYRGNWCPYCSRYLAALSDSIRLIKETQARFVAVSPENKENVAKSAENLAKEISILSDVGGVIMKAYDVDFEVTKGYQTKVNLGLQRSIKKSNDQEVAVLPVPATYIIGTDGKIMYRHFDLNYSQRASIASILSALK